jgi:hypothetical protein
VQSKQDGTGIPKYDAETKETMKKLGPGGNGNVDRMEDAKRGVTPELAKEDGEGGAKAATPKKSPPANHDLHGPLDDS